jgi:hypothetical protein
MPLRSVCSLPPDQAVADEDRRRLVHQVVEAGERADRVAPQPEALRARKSPIERLSRWRRRECPIRPAARCTFPPRHRLDQVGHQPAQDRAAGILRIRLRIGFTPDAVERIEALRASGNGDHAADVEEVRPPC